MHRKELLESDGQFAPLSSKLLKEVVYDYKKYLAFLVDNDVLLTDNHFILGEKCREYRFNAPYAGRKLKELKRSNYKLRQAIRRAAEKRNKENKESMWGYSYLTKWWDTNKLKIDTKAANAWIDNYEQEKINAINADAKIIDKTVLLENARDTTEDFRTLVKGINHNTARYCFSGKGHRFYNPISNLKSELRSFLTYDGQPLVDIDIKNSQPFLATALLKSSFWAPDKKANCQKLCLQGISKEISKEVRSNKILGYIITLLETSETLHHSESDLKNYTDLVLRGLFYEYIQHHFQNLYPERFSNRKDVKREVLRIFYVENKKTGWEFYRPCRTFKKLFPNVSELFRLIKEIQSNYLPIILQRLESFIMLDVVCKKLSNQHPAIPFFTIHDNIITTKGNEDIVKDVMNKEIIQLLGYPAQLEPSDLIPIVKETWMPIIGYEGYYEISNTGIVRSNERKVALSKGERTIRSRILNSRINNRGYKDVRLSKNGITSTKLVHILSATAFVPNPENKPEVNHLDGNRLNNHCTNFSWVTHGENIQHAYDIGLIKMKSKAVVDKCTGETYPSIKKAAKAINMNYGTCRNSLNGNIKTNKTCLRLAS